MLQVQRSDLCNGRDTRTGLPPPLTGGMKLNSIEMPVCAIGRVVNNQPVTDAQLSYPMARGCAKLLAGEIDAVELVGSASDTSPSGIHITLSNGTSQAWVYLEQSPSGKILKLCGMPFSSQLVNYNAGISTALFLLQNKDTYHDFSIATQAAVNAWSGSSNDILKAQTLALMADELTLAVEQMIDGRDPLGIRCILMDRERPADLEQIFDGGDLLMQAFTDPDVSRQFAGTTKQPVVDTPVMEDPLKSAISFVGDLPVKLSDCIKRGKHVLLTGPTATGKTLCLEEVCMQLNAPLTIIKGSEGLEDRDMIGATVLSTDISPSGDIASRTAFTPGPLIEAMNLGRRQYNLHLLEVENAAMEKREPKCIVPSVLLIDEVNRLQLRHQNFLVSMMNVRKATQDYYLRVPDTNEEVTCPARFLVIVAARNIGNAFLGTNPMDLALERRFYKKIQVDYLQPEPELSLVQSQTGLDEKLARVLVKVASDTRYQLSQLKAPLDTGTLLAWAEELAWQNSAGAAITDQLLLETARDVVFDITLERSERGGFDPAAEAVLADNISENWRDIFAC